MCQGVECQAEIPRHKVRQPGAGLEDSGILPHDSRDGVANVFKRILGFLQEPQRLVSPTPLIFAAGNSLSASGQTSDSLSSSARLQNKV